MSTGPEHYRQAEEWARQAREVMEQIGALGPVARTEDVLTGSAQVRDLLAAGQLHATLALVAATAELTTHQVNGEMTTGRRPSESSAWGLAFGEVTSQ